jgi:hypothetical protein
MVTFPFPLITVSKEIGTGSSVASLAEILNRMVR